MRERTDRCAVVQRRVVRVHPIEASGVGHSDERVRSEEAVVLDDQDPRAHDAQRSEQPVVHSVYVDRHEVDVAPKACVPDDRVQVLDGEKRRAGGDPVSPGEPALVEEPRVAITRVDGQPPPVVHLDEEARVRLSVVLDTELDERALAERHTLHEPLDDAVFAELGEDPELGVFELHDVADAGGVKAPDLDPEGVEITSQRPRIAQHGSGSRLERGETEPIHRRARLFAMRVATRPCSAPGVSGGIGDAVLLTAAGVAT